MSETETPIVVGVLGAGTMGRGIAQVAASKGHRVVLNDASRYVLDDAEASLKKILNRLVEKGRLTADEVGSILGRIDFTERLSDFCDCHFIIEAIVENLDIKKSVFREIEERAPDDAILASNTSSLSIAAIGAACKRPERVLGVHFFNPAPLMPLVEIVPGVASDPAIVRQARKLIDDWGKVTVLAKDTPGFIVNRVARPFYGEALRILEENVADVATIDWAMKEIGGFRMGPFQLMDFIGNDINYKVTETVFEAFFYDPRYKPSFTQKRMTEAGFLGRKSGRGYYHYGEDAVNPEPVKDLALGETIVSRIRAMLINEAVDAVFLNIASPEDIDLAMTRGVNYPKGLLAWADELGLETVLRQLEELQEEYGEDRYRPSPLMKRMVRNQRTFFPGGKK